jgi:hypothetical protein
MQTNDRVVCARLQGAMVVTLAALLSMASAGAATVTPVRRAAHFNSAADQMPWVLHRAASWLPAEQWTGTPERLDFIHIDSPLGQISLISRELDDYGRIKSVNLLAFDDPNSPWDISLKVRHGAMLRLTRKWGGSSAKPMSVAGAGYIPANR